MSIYYFFTHGLYDLLSCLLRVLWIQSLRHSARFKLEYSLFLFFKVFCMVSADASQMDFFLSFSRYFSKHCTSWWTERVLVNKDNWIILFAKCEFLLSELVHYQNMLFCLLFKMCAIISDSLIHSFVRMMWMELGWLELVRKKS